MTDLAALVALGDTIAQMNPDVGQAREAYFYSVPDVMITLPTGKGASQRGLARIGYNIGLAVSNTHSQPGPTQDAIKNELNQNYDWGGPVSDGAFNAARQLMYQMTLAGRVLLVTGTEAMPSPEILQQIDSLATRGKAIAYSLPAVNSASMANPSDAWQKGFMVATAFCQGNSLPGPGQTAMKNNLRNLYGFATTAGIEAGNGFDVGQAIQFGITRARTNATPLSANPQVAAGQLAINGIANQPAITPDQKAAVATTIANSSPAAKAGAQAGIADNQPGFFKRFLQFFGLA